MAFRITTRRIALAPDNADLHYRRGQCLLFPALEALEMIYDPTPSPSLVPARADFSRVVEKNPKDAMALDMLEF